MSGRGAQHRGGDEDQDAAHGGGAQPFRSAASEARTGDGSSWANAFPGLADSLSGAASGTEIWVAKGTYKPTSGTDRTATFQLKDGVAVYGGFAGGETQLDQRGWALAQSGVSYTINFYDSGKSGKSSSDTFGIRIVYTPVAPQPALLRPQAKECRKWNRTSVPSGVWSGPSIAICAPRNVSLPSSSVIWPLHWLEPN